MEKAIFLLFGGDNSCYYKIFHSDASVCFSVPMMTVEVQVFLKR